MILIVFMIFPWHRKHLFWVGGGPLRIQVTNHLIMQKIYISQKILPWKSEIKNCLNRCIGAEMSEETLMYFKLSTATFNFE